MNTDPGNATIASPSFAGGCSAPQVPSRMKAICKGSSQNSTDLLAGSMNRERLQRTNHPSLAATTSSVVGLLQPHMKSLPQHASPTLTPKAAPQRTWPSTTARFSRTTKSMLGVPIMVDTMDTGTPWKLPAGR